MRSTGSRRFNVVPALTRPWNLAACAKAGIAQILLDANRNLSFYWFSLRFGQEIDSAALLISGRASLAADYVSTPTNYETS
jgi:hypothetical protein